MENLPVRGEDALLPEDLYTVAQVREIDRYLIQDQGIPGIRLMKQAGYSAFCALRDNWPEARSIRVVCGGGNNAGDGYVVAQLALLAGLDVRVCALLPPDRLAGDAAVAAAEWQAVSGGLNDCSEDALAEADVIVDALLGTGLDRPVSGRFAEIIEKINGIGVPVLALDIPSGLNGDRGVVMGGAVRASVTVTFIALKQGLLTGQAPEFCGKLLFAGIGLQDGHGHGQVAAVRRLSLAATRLPPRSPAAHKGWFGHALLCGGSPGFSGAIRMAAESAARTGAGLVSVATHPEHAALINQGRPEIMCAGIPQDAAGLQELLAASTVIGVGPGLGQCAWGQRLLEQALECGKPCVVDADGLNLLARHPAYNDNWILTPHPGEAARLLGCTTAEVSSDRFAAVTSLQQKYGGVVLLKGAGTLVSGGGAIWLCTGGNPGMASGGMGDILTGVITGLLAQGLPLLQAAVSGVMLHAEAADRAAAANGQRGLLATDLLDHLHSLVNRT